MPFFEANPLDLLALQAGDAEAELDLRGLDRTTAIALVEQLLADLGVEAARSYHIRFDPPAGDGVETLFQPLGRRLLQARRDGRLKSCLPLSDGSGYFIAIAA